MNKPSLDYNKPLLDYDQTLDSNKPLVSHQTFIYIFLSVIISLNLILMVYIVNFNTIISELYRYTPEIKKLIDIACYDLNC